MSTTIAPEIFVSIVVYWSIALAPPLLTRFLILKKPLGKAGCWAFLITFWFINFTIQWLSGFHAQQIDGGEMTKPNTIHLFLMAWASYAILRYGPNSKSAALTHDIGIHGAFQSNEREEPHTHIAPYRLGAAKHKLIFYWNKLLFLWLILSLLLGVLLGLTYRDFVSAIDSQYASQKTHWRVMFLESAKVFFVPGRVTTAQELINAYSDMSDSELISAADSKLTNVYSWKSQNHLQARAHYELSKAQLLAINTEISAIKNERMRLSFIVWAGISLLVGALLVGVRRLITRVRRI